MVKPQLKENVPNIHYMVAKIFDKHYVVCFDSVTNINMVIVVQL